MDTALKQLIDKLFDENNMEELQVLWFLLKKMEYKQKQKNNISNYIQYVEDLLDNIPPRGYNPTK